MKFSDLINSDKLCSALSRLSVCEPRPIQQLVIPAAIEGRDILTSAQTGSGKTLSYLLPLLVGLENSANPQASIEALILAPTRELAQQISAVCQSLGGACAVIVGGVEYNKQKEALRECPKIVIATPGRLLDLIEQGAISFESLRYFVLDEVDQMLDLGFYEPITRLSELRRSDTQTLCFSATLPEKVIEVVKELAPAIEHLKIENESVSVASIEQVGYYVSLEMMDHLLLHVLRQERPECGIIFTRSRKMAERIVELLSRNNIASEAIHSDKKQAAREYIIDRFRQGQTKLLVATDVIARGIDVDSVTHIFNIGLPQTPEQYIHRCGRTGRAGRNGKAISLFTKAEKPMLDAICRHMKRHITIEENHPYF